MPQSDHDIQTDLRQVVLPIRARLLASLHEPNHRNKHSRVPKPAGENVQSFFPPNKIGAGRLRWECNCPKNLPESQLRIPAHDEKTSQADRSEQ